MTHMVFDNSTTDRLRQDKSAILSELQRAGADVGNARAIRCPWHDDHSPSGGVWQGDGGVWRYTCQTPSCGASGDAFDLRARINGTTVEAELRAERERHNPPKRDSGSRATDGPPEVSGRDSGEPAAKGGKFAAVSLDALKVNDSRIVAVYHYPDRAHVRLAVVRMMVNGKKSFRQLHPVDGGFAWGGIDAPYPLLNESSVRDAKTIIITEGEKDVVTLTKLGFTATTSAGGAGKASHTDWGACGGPGKFIFLWPDADAPNTKGVRTGVAHMREVHRQLQALPDPPRAFWVDPDKLGLTGGADVTDFLADHVDLDDARKAALIHKVMQDAEPLGPSAEVRSLIEDAIAGRRRTIRWPWRDLTDGSKALTPASVTLIVAPPAASKSFLMLQCAQFWQNQGFNPAVLMLEAKRDFHLRRALAQHAGLSAITDDEWCELHPEEARQPHIDHADFLDTFGCCVHTPPGDGGMTFDDVADWIEEQSIAGRDIIVVDPLSLAEIARDQYVKDQRFISRVKRVTEQFGVRVILVLHPRKGAVTRTLDDVSGGASYTRLAESVVWLEFLKDEETVTVRDHIMNLRVEKSINRVIHILKARNGRGTGWSLGYWFDPGSLTFAERGLILKD